MGDWWRWIFKICLKNEDDFHWSRGGGGSAKIKLYGDKKKCIIQHFLYVQ